MDKYCVCIENDKKYYWTVEDRYPGKIILIRGINYNKLIYHLSYSGVYQYVVKNESSTKR